jgi:hypothetical protein
MDFPNTWLESLELTLHPAADNSKSTDPLARLN